MIEGRKWTVRGIAIKQERKYWDKGFLNLHQKGVSGGDMYYTSIIPQLNLDNHLAILPRSISLQYFYITEHSLSFFTDATPIASKV